MRARKQDSCGLLCGLCLGFLTAVCATAGAGNGGGGVVTGDVNAVNSHVTIGGGAVGNVNSSLVVGNGRLITKTLPVASAFHGVELSGVFEAEIQCGKAASVEVSVDENLQPLLAASVRDGVLCVTFTKPVQTKQTPRLKITVPSLDILRVSGSDQVDVTEIKGKSLLLEHAGTGKVTVAGKVGSLVCTVNGTGAVDAGKLVCDEATISLSGVGNAVCRPEKKLSVTITGIGGVRCLTRPAEVKRDISGLGDIEFAGK